MPKNSRVLGLIPARQNSKGVPGKNFREIAGKPLIEWTIEEALKSELDEVIVSTDKSDYSYSGVKVVLRPPELAQDDTPMLEVVKSVIDERPLMILQPTCPLRKAQHINQAIKLMEKTGASSVVSVVPVPIKHHPEWVFMKKDKWRTAVGKEIKDRPTRRQDFPPAFVPNGYIYLIKPENLSANPPNLYGEKIELYYMDENLNIDTWDDWREAEKKLWEWKRSK